MKPVPLSLTILSIFLVTALAFVAHKALSAHASIPGHSAHAQDISGRGPVRMIRFVLSDDGLYPRQMRIDQGLVNIALEDKTSRSEGLLIQSVVGDQRVRLTQIAPAEKQRRGRSLLGLVPGRYIVSDASQPNHTAELMVNPY